MGRRLLAISLLALLAAAPAAAEQRVLWPGVTFESAVQFTSHGPVAVNVIIGPRPGGTTTLAPVLANESMNSRETLTAMQRRLSGLAVTAGVNGDFFTFKTGEPSGVLMREGQLASPPYGERSSAGVTSDGTLDVRRVSFFGTWKGSAGRRTLNALNGPPPANGIALYTPAWGLATPRLPGTRAAILFPFPAVVPNADLEAPVVEQRSGGAPVPIPFGGAVLVATGSSAGALAAEASAGQQVSSRLIFRPDWPDLVSAIGGGPQIVRNGAPIFRAGEAFTTSQLSPRVPRTGIGQLADGRIILVAVGGPLPGLSVGMTNFELAQTLVRLGAVTAMAFDGGGSTAMAFDGSLLNRPLGSERQISTAFLLQYTGVFLPEPLPVVSPDGDGVGDRQTLRYRLFRPSTVVVALEAPGGSVVGTETVERPPGTYAVAFPPVAAASPPASLPAGTAPTVAREAEPPAPGRWQLEVSSIDDTGQSSAMSRSFMVNTSIGFLRAASRLYLPPLGRELPFTWRQSRAARVVVTIESRDGTVVRTLARRTYPRDSTPALVWNGLGRDRTAVKGGRYVIRVAAKNAFGSMELTRDVTVQRIVGPKQSA